MRSPTFPPEVFIHFRPVPRISPYHADGALMFGSRTNVPAILPPLPSPPIPPELGSATSPSSSHSYPPTPNISIEPSAHGPPGDADIALPHEAQEFLSPSATTPAPAKVRAPPPTQVTEFVLAPLSTHPIQAQAASTGSVLSKAVSFLRTHAPHHSNSFTLARIPQATPPPPYVPASSELPNAGARVAQTHSSPPAPPPLLNFHDRTPVLTAHAFTGLLEIDRDEERMLGVDTGFWIAVALTYLEFLGERESYLAALSD
ncbi:hypothetical protein HGRIS_007080 [Hohenbuehelia grisea]|uniref:Uncharacterized protein n=1 Tax=Hohenbuehelia grisea TaxID=104357 RepID=A0ABR3JBL0_9AGAR